MPARGKARTLRGVLGLLTIVVAGGLALPAWAGNEARLPVPRFASLRSDEVNLRAGPGVRYPIEWVFKRRKLPVEIIAEFEHWRQVRDWQGDQGWVQEHMVAGTRSVVVQGGVEALHSQPAAGSAIVARAEPGVIARLAGCQGGWCQIEAKGITGWLPRGAVWGVLPNETLP